jgi:hypothetical protein
LQGVEGVDAGLASWPSAEQADFRRSEAEPGADPRVPDDDLVPMVNVGENQDDGFCTRRRRGEQDLANRRYGAMLAAEQPATHDLEHPPMSTDAPQARTTTLTFDEAETSELLKLVEAALGDLRVEVHRTHTPDYRVQLLQREELLKRLIEKFQPRTS